MASSTERVVRLSVFEAVAQDVLLTVKRVRSSLTPCCFRPLPKPWMYATNSQQDWRDRRNEEDQVGTRG